jgi:glycosyltransferase involved in cell wall biosynthesis
MSSTRSLTPAVSIVMATYNYARFIAQAIESVQAQTFTNWELIIVDDGSTDDTSHVVDTYLRDSRIRYHRTQNHGQPSAKNTGIRLCAAPLIAFLDADDAWLPMKLERQLPLLDIDSRIGVTYTNRWIMDERGEIITRTEKLPMFRGDVVEFAFRQTIPPFSSTIVRKCVFEKVGLFYEDIPLAIDYDLWFRAAMEFHFDYVDEPLLLYRTGHANLSRRGEERREIVLKQIMPRLLDECGGGQRLSRRAIRSAYADTFANMGHSSLQTSRLSACSWYSRAIALRPNTAEAWKGLIKCLLPRNLLKE